MLFLWFFLGILWAATGAYTWAIVMNNDYGRGPRYAEDWVMLLVFMVLGLVAVTITSLVLLANWIFD